ncbi:transcriptional regulator, GntR family protein [Janibacter sp. HTCC2649]|uniref:GntR family transcriptional regulator n=1 Tax=Janibacter sp. HTCC2649 TaxID=313589 RepID=UPI0000671809|nr:GntR family transcriptional regulator [Janibacter sp. HTCC2649]EAP98361.1 transcriptional regulator, GntR family protein [Janibacter sp. HTCC2649]
MAGQPEVEDSRPTKQSQVVSRLRTLADTLGSGAMLPTERTLAEEWGVARMTVRGAIAVLTREGRLRAEQGRGTFVRPPAIALRVRLGSFADEVKRAQLNPTTRTLERSLDDAPPEAVRAHLRLRAGAAAVRLDRLRLGDGNPLALERVWLPASLARPLLKGEPPASLYGWLGDRGHLPDAGEESVVVGFPTAPEQHHLAISSAAPIVRLTRRATAAGVPVEYAEAVLPADRYELWFPLAAGPDGRLTAAPEAR